MEPTMKRMLQHLPEIGLLTVGVLLLVPFVPALHARLTVGTQDQRCRDNLNAIYRAIQQYRTDHDGAYPASLAPPPRSTPDEPVLGSLVPHYLSNTADLVCPLDPSGGVKLGWAQPCSYEYGLQELRSRSAKVRRLVGTGLIDRYGPHLRLVVCPSHHRLGPPGLLTIHADGRISKELVVESDPQLQYHWKLWRLEGAAGPTASRNGRGRASQLNRKN
jgi:hypothetical protein